MYRPDKGYLPSAPAYPQPGAEGVYPAPPPYGFGEPQPPGAEGAYPAPPPYGFGGPQNPGAEGAYPDPPPYGFGGPQNPGAEGAYPAPPPYGFGGPQNPGVGVAYPTAPGVGGLQPTGVGVAYPTAPGVGGLQPTVVMAPVTTVFMATSFSDIPASCTCPVCRENILTRIQHTNGLLVWTIFGTLILIGCWLGCCLIPFCLNSCKDVDHYCPKCNHHLSKYKRP